MNPERAMVFLGDLNRAGWLLVIGPFSVAAIHPSFGAVAGRGDDMASRLDDVRSQLQKRELCE
jgi:hypothetical protein